MRKRNYEFIGKCCDLRAEDLEYMYSKARPVTYDTFIKHIPHHEIKAMFSYMDRGGLSLRKDRYVEYFKSKWKGMKPCYYMVHSREDYVWVIL